MRQMRFDWRWVILGSAVAALSTAGVASASAASQAKPDHHVAAAPEKSPGGKSGEKAVHIGGGTKAFAERGPQKLSFRGAHVNLNNAVYYHSDSRAAGHTDTRGTSKNGKMRFPARETWDESGYGGSLQCVPFARAASGIELKGNAADWWYAAAGVYDRGERPELGSVLNFRSISRMRLGHVAVVTGVINSREIEVDQANWAGAGAFKGGVQRGVHVIDVSGANDWTQVRVALGNGDFGSTYPTYGFIYDRPDTGTMMASRHSAPEDDDATPTEVAEAPAPMHVHSGRTRGAATREAHVIRVSYHEPRAPEREHEAPSSRHSESLRPLVHHIRFN